ncbi:MAG: hypothetical protein ABIQ93_06900 [Saprospiraceae bacterium]
MKTTITLILFLQTCFLLAQTTRYVNQNVPGGLQNGSSWENAFPDLQQALAIAQAGDTIWVAAGTYMPTPNGDRSSSFWLISATVLYGGFNGTETAFTQRNPVANPTILSGEMALPASATTIPTTWYGAGD